MHYKMEVEEHERLGGDEYPNIIRIGYIQHMKYKLLDYGENDSDAKGGYSTMNQLFHKEYKHTIEVMVETNLEYRK